MAAGSAIEDEWEYEYSTTETETFLVDLDLSSVNGVIKSKNAGDRKSLKRPGRTAKDEIISIIPNDKKPDEADDIQNQDDAGDNDEIGEEEADNDENPTGNSPAQPQSPQEPRLLDDDFTGRVQILDLNTTNPIVSYDGQIYSCTWHDMLGTSMFISKHQDAPFHEPEISTDDYDLVGTSRIKLVGHRAKVLPKPESKKRRREDEEETMGEVDSVRRLQRRIPDGRSLGTITRTNPRTNIEIKQQASFLEKLMEIKKSRGEIDTVRTFVDRHTVAADAKYARQAKAAKEKGKEKEQTAEQRRRQEIQELNKRVVKGDNDALERLQEIYADMEEVDDEDNEFSIGGVNSNQIRTGAPSNAEGSRHTGNLKIPTTGSAEAPHATETVPNGASDTTAPD